MIVWIASYPRSGNSFLRLVLNRSFGIKTFSLYNDPLDIGADPILADAIGHVSHGPEREVWVRETRLAADNFYVKTHALPEDDAKAIYVIRDGRAAIVSYHHYRRDFAHEHPSLAEVVLGEVWGGDWTTHAQAWALSGRPNTLVLRFEDLIGGGAEPLAMIADFLRLPRPSPVHVEFSDLHTLSPKFFRSGSNATAIAELEADSPALFWSVHGQTMRQLGYTADIPVFPSAQLSAEIRRFGAQCAARKKAPDL